CFHYRSSPAHSPLSLHDALPIFIDSVEGKWNSGREHELDGSPNRGYKTPYKGGYFPVPPVDHYADLRDQMTKTLGEVGLSVERADRKSTRLNSSHVKISYAVFCL